MGCERHPDVVETRRCVGCAKVWCDACARAVGLTAHVVCVECGHELKPYAPVQSGAGTLQSAVRRAISTEGLTTSAAMAALYAIGGSLYAVFLIYVAALVSYYFVITHHVGAGHAGLPGPTDTVDNWGDTVTKAIGGLVTAALGFAPLIAFSVMSDEPLDLRMVLGLLVVGQLYMPAVILSVALTNTATAAIWPVTWIRVIARAPAAYIRFVGMWIVSVVIGLVWFRVAVELGTSIPALAVASFVWNLYWFAQAALVGEHIRQNAEAFGWD